MGRLTLAPSGLEYLFTKEELAVGIVVIARVFVTASGGVIGVDAKFRSMFGKFYENNWRCYHSFLRDTIVDFQEGDDRNRNSDTRRRKLAPHRGVGCRGSQERLDSWSECGHFDFCSRLWDESRARQSADVCYICTDTSRAPNAQNRNEGRKLKCEVFRKWEPTFC